MNNVTIYLPDEFRLLCILSGVDPKELLQSFADAVIIPSEHFKPDVLSTLASNLILDYVREEGLNAKAYSQEQKAFLKKKEQQYQTLRKNSKRYGAEESAEAMKFFLRLWLKGWEEKYAGGDSQGPRREILNAII